MPSLPRDDSDMAGTPAMWCLVDYGWLADSARSLITTQSNPYAYLSLDCWPENERPDAQEAAAVGNRPSQGSFAGDPWADITDPVQGNIGPMINEDWGSSWEQMII